MSSTRNRTTLGLVAARPSAATPAADNNNIAAAKTKTTLQNRIRFMGIPAISLVCRTLSRDRSGGETLIGNSSTGFRKPLSAMSLRRSQDRLK
jgi:hypothetical protein